MTPHPPVNGEPKPFVFPQLPIVTPEPEPARRSTSERYGALFYLGIAGLLILVSLVGWFGWEAWSLRSLWSSVYVLHDGLRPEPERVQAAYALSRDPRANARQLYDISLNRQLPALGRYLIAEAPPAEAAEADPRAYVLAVARSEGWPGWLRVLLARPIAYAAAAGRPFPREPLVELAGNPDPAVALWATYALAKAGDAVALASLMSATSKDDQRGLAFSLLRSFEATRPADSLKALDDATLWLRDHHPEAVKVWAEWEVRDGRIEPRSAPELH